MNLIATDMIDLMPSPSQQKKNIQYEEKYRCAHGVRPRQHLEKVPA